MTERRPDISVVILTLDEEENIPRVIGESKEVLSEMGLEFEIIVVDGGSRDQTREVAEQLGARVFVQRRSGYGGALREGFMAACGDYVLCLDADCSHPPELTQDLWARRHEGDIIVASRFVPGGRTGASTYRNFLSRVLNTVFSKALSIPVRDISSGFRLYRRDILAADKYISDDFDILQEVLIRAYCDGYTVLEIPLVYLPRYSGSSHADVMKLSRSYLRTLYRLWVLRNSVESADYDHRAFDSRIPLQLYWQRRRHWLVNDFLEGDKGKILDIGCGSSRIIQGLPDAVAFDLAAHKLRFLRRTNRLRVRGSTFQLPFADNSFDKVVHSQVLEHIPFDESIYFELNRVLRPDGLLVVGTPDYGRPWWPIIEYFYGKLLPNAYADEHITHYTRPMLTDILAEFGFRTLDYKYICGGELIMKVKKVEEVRRGQDINPALRPTVH